MSAAMTGDGTRTGDPGFVRTDVLAVAAMWLSTTLLVAAGTLLGNDYVGRSVTAPSRNADLISSLARGDGRKYKQLIEDGYSYLPDEPSNIAFFPAFPALASLLVDCTGIRTELALVLVAQFFFACASIVLVLYLRLRFPDSKADFRVLVLFAFGMFPCTFFFRMAYSESVFVFFAILALYGMECTWPAWLIALIVGFATATRPVGVVLVLCFVIDLIRRKRSQLGRELLLFVPLACWGILVFMAYQYLAFGDPMAFAKTQFDWRRRPAESMGQKLLDLATVEPIRAVFDPTSPCYWSHDPSEKSPFFSLHLANPFYWTFAIGLLALAIKLKCLNMLEVVLSLGLLLIPYFLRGHEMCMFGMARFAAVAFPLYIVFGNVLSRLPYSIAMPILGVGGVFLCLYTALFTAGFRFF